METVNRMTCHPANQAAAAITTIAAVNTRGRIKGSNILFEQPRCQR